MPKLPETRISASKDVSMVAAGYLIAQKKNSRGLKERQEGVISHPHDNISF